MATLGFQGAALVDLTQPVGRRVRWLPRPESGREVFSATTWSADGQRLAGTPAGLHLRLAPVGDTDLVVAQEPRLGLEEFLDALALVADDVEHGRLGQ